MSKCCQYAACARFGYYVPWSVGIDVGEWILVGIVVVVVDGVVVGVAVVVVVEVVVVVVLVDVLNVDHGVLLWNCES